MPKEEEATCPLCCLWPKISARPCLSIVPSGQRSGSMGKLLPKSIVWPALLARASAMRSSQELLRKCSSFKLQLFVVELKLVEAHVHRRHLVVPVAPTRLLGVGHNVPPESSHPQTTRPRRQLAHTSHHAVLLGAAGCQTGPLVIANHTRDHDMSTRTCPE